MQPSSPSPRLFLGRCKYCASRRSIAGAAQVVMGRYDRRQREKVFLSCCGLSPSALPLLTGKCDVHIHRTVGTRNYCIVCLVYTPLMTWPTRILRTTLSHIHTENHLPRRLSMDLLFSFTLTASSPPVIISPPACLGGHYEFDDWSRSLGKARGRCQACKTPTPDCVGLLFEARAAFSRKAQICSILCFGS